MLQLNLTSNHRQSSNRQTAKTQYTAVLGQGMIENNPLLPVLLNQSIQRWFPWHRITKRSETLKPSRIAGWGRKKSYYRAKKLARTLNKPVVTIEDGFLRSLTTGTQSRYGCSVVVDNLGIYFDSRQPSMLEQHIIYRLQNLSSIQEQRAQQLINQIILNRLSKYNTVIDSPVLSATEWSVEGKRETDIEHVLVIDQVVDDASIKGAGVTGNVFERMVNQACQTHSTAKVWIKAHPASNKGYLSQPKVLARLKRKYGDQIGVLDAPCNPIGLLQQANYVYTVSSHMGFEALMLGKQVHCFGVNWYAGWGITHDKYAPQKLLKKVIKRREKLGQINSENKRIFSLFYAAYIDYSRYVDPASKKPCEIEQVIVWLVTNRYWYLKQPKKVTVFDFSRWKIPFVKQFLMPMQNNDQAKITVKNKPKFRFVEKYIENTVNHLCRLNIPMPRLTALPGTIGLSTLLGKKAIDMSSDVLVWGLASRQSLQNIIAQSSQHIHTEHQQHHKLTYVQSPTIWCMEDGFIRSNGLGATLLAPLSVVMDAKGIYYNATQTSDLEQLIANSSCLNESQIIRVEQLHLSLLNKRVSKYHVGQSKSVRIPSSVVHLKTPILLIVGQVEDDLSVKYCGSPIVTNTALIERVRQDNPEAYLIFKPHPDVEAGLRQGKVDEKTLNLVNDVTYDVAMPNCLDVVDEVHTISSLTGFEALLRDKKVYCYGLPFYAGWGLTTDIDAHLQPKNTFVQRRQMLRKTFIQKSPLTGDKIEDTEAVLAISLNQLIYTTLIVYPLYRLPDGHGLAQVEQVIDYLYNTPTTVDASQSKGENATDQNSGQLSSLETVMAKIEGILDLAFQKRKAITKWMQIKNRLKR